MFTALFIVLVVSVGIIILERLLDKKPKPIFGIYQRKNGVYWVKVVFIYVIFYLKKIYHRLFMTNMVDYYTKIDKVQKLALTPKAVDAVFFTGANKNGDYMALGHARRPERLVDGFLYLKISSLEIGLLESLKLPDTTLFNQGEEESYEAEGTKIIPREPLKKWEISYNGRLKERRDPEKFHDVTIDAVFHSDEPCFNYNLDLDPWTMAKNISYEKWSRTYFQNLEQTHQLHYQQFGTLKAKISIDKKEYVIELDAVRDHSVGKHRDWATFRRYALHWITTETGDRFSLLSVCQPINFSRLQLGFMWNASKAKMYPIKDCSLELYQYGELGNPPKDYAFTFKAGNVTYAMQVNILDSPHFYISKDWECKVYECHCVVEINGIKGHGGVEWEYRNVKGRLIVKTQKKSLKQLWQKRLVMSWRDLELKVFSQQVEISKAGKPDLKDSH